MDGEGVDVSVVIIVVIFSGHGVSLSGQKRETNDEERQNKFPHRSG
jgi:hypothetical protein